MIIEILLLTRLQTKQNKNVHKTTLSFLLFDMLSFSCKNFQQCTCQFLLYLINWFTYENQKHAHTCHCQVLFFLIVFVFLQESQAGYMLILMIIYWVSEVFPLSITALLPVFLLPLFGISSATELTSNYLEVN